MDVARRIPAAVLVVVLGILPLQAWLRASRPDVSYTQAIDEFEGVTWSAAVSPDGQLSVTIVYALDDSPRDVSIRLPSGGRFLRADGVPIPSQSGRYADTRSHGTFTVTYQRVGAVTRYPDGVIVDFAGTESPDQQLFACATCYLDVDTYGNASLTGALFADDLTDARIAFNGLDQLHTGIDDGALRFVGVLPGADSAGMVAWLPVSAAPDAPTESDVPGAVSGETAAAVWDAMRDAADEPLREAGSGPPIGRIASALILTAMWLALVGWIVWRIVAAKRILAADVAEVAAPRDATFSPPSALEPAVVGVLVGDTGRGGRSPVAATLLELARRGVVDIEGIDSTRFRFTIPPGATGRTKVEEAVLGDLRPQGQLTSTATLKGPPLWGAAEGPAIEQRVGRLAAAEARAARLMRVTLAAWVLVPASLAMGIVAIIASGGSSWLAWVITFTGPVVAIAATVLTGTSLTAKGRAERELWVQYGDWLRSNSRLDDVGPPGIATWGEPLVYAAVLGAAPRAAKALGG